MPNFSQVIALLWLLSCVVFLIAPAGSRVLHWSGLLVIAGLVGVLLAGLYGQK